MIYTVENEGDLWRSLMRYRKSNAGLSPTVIRCNPALVLKVSTWRLDFASSFGLHHVIADPKMLDTRVAFGDVITLSKRADP